jgi:hypothetical protein
MSFLSPQEPRIADVVEDTSPQLGGALDPNGYAIEGVTAAIGGDITLTPGSGTPAAGTQQVDVGGARVGGDVTGLAADTAGFADAAISGAPAGSVVPGIAAATYDFDVTIDGGGLQQNTIITAGGEDYDAIAALMSTAVTGGSVAFVAGSFRITSATTGISSAATVAAGTLGSGGGDLFAAIDTAATVTTTFPAPTGGVTTVYTAAAVVDGGASQPISIVGDVAQTYTTLLSELNADTTGAVWSIAGGNLLLTSDTTGGSSSVAITDTDLFSTLTTYVAVDAATAGLNNDGAVIVTATGAPNVITDKLYNEAGALTWNGIDLTTVVSDLSPQLGGDLEVNGFSIISAAGSGFGSGGTINITAGLGGGNGDGGAVLVTGGQGGAIFGDGGTAALRGGDAGAAGTGGPANVVGGVGVGPDNGGAANITGGLAGSTGDGGVVNITGGAGVATGLFTATGGHVNITSGQGFGDNYSGTINISTPNTEFYAGAVNITAGDITGDGYDNSPNEAYTGGHINIIAGGNGYTGNSEPYTYGGNVTITGGFATNGYGGYVSIYSGASYYGSVAEVRGAAGGGTYTGAFPGNVTIRGGFSGSNGTRDGGNVTVGGGFGNDSAGGGDVTVYGGGAQNFGTQSGLGGKVTIKGGRNGDAGGTPGNVIIEGGDATATSAGAGGDIVLTPGINDGAGSPGAVVVTAQTAPTVTTNKLYNVAGALTWNAIDLTVGVTKFAQDNTTTNVTEAFNHALGSTDVIVQVYDLTESPKALMIPSFVSITDANNLQIVMAVAPAIGDYRVVILA